VVEVNQQNSTILYPDQGSPSNEPKTRKRGRPRKPVSPEQFAKVPINPQGEVWPFPRIKFSSEINSEVVSFDTSCIGSPEGEGKASACGDVLCSDPGTGRSERGDQPSLQPGEKRRRRAPKLTAVLDQPGDLQVVQPSEANTVQAEPVKQAPTLARQTSEVKKPAPTPQSRPSNKSPIGLIVRGLNKVFGR